MPESVWCLERLLCKLSCGRLEGILILLLRRFYTQVQTAVRDGIVVPAPHVLDTCTATIQGSEFTISSYICYLAAWCWLRP